MALVNPPKQQVPENIRNEFPAIAKYLEEYAFFHWQMYQRTGGGDDAIEEVKIGELYEPGIATLDADEISQNVEEAPIGLDLLERLEDLENTINAGNDFSERIEDLENMVSLGNDFSERIEAIENDLIQPGVDLSGLGFETVTVTTSFTTTGNQIIICNNASDITITMNESPDDGERAYIKRSNTGGVDVASTDNIDGVATRSISLQYDCPLLVYTSNLDEWSVI